VIRVGYRETNSVSRDLGILIYIQIVVFVYNYLYMYKFSIICYFDDEVTAEIRNIQKDLSEITGSTGSLRAWVPHVTVGSGLCVEEHEVDTFCHKIEIFLSQYKPFVIKSEGYSFIDNWSGVRLGYEPYVVHIKPAKSELLASIANFFELDLKTQYPSWYDQPWPYNPHITIAYKDLNIEGFKKAKEYCRDKKIEREILIDNVCLAVEGVDGKWVSYKRFGLK
jgi:2'-5' RNA ligase